MRLPTGRRPGLPARWKNCWARPMMKTSLDDKIAFVTFTPNLLMKNIPLRVPGKIAGDPDRR